MAVTTISMGPMNAGAFVDRVGATVPTVMAYTALLALVVRVAIAMTLPSASKFLIPVSSPVVTTNVS